MNYKSRKTKGPGNFGAHESTKKRLNMLAEGYSVAEIASVEGVSPSSIYQLIKRWGSGIKFPTREQATTTTFKDVVELVKNKKISASEAIELLKVS